MVQVSQERILKSIETDLQRYAHLRSAQENLINLAELLGFSVWDVNQGLSHAIVMGGATGPGETWPINWQAAQLALTTEQVKGIEAAYLEIIEAFPRDLKQQHTKAFEKPRVVG